mgnify:FL=1
MWGKERGKILINQKSSFGNVLPESIREFAFKWQGENNLFEIGRYKAIATLSFGKEARQNVFRAAYFWVVPLKPTLGILGGLIIFILFMAWAIRVYIRRALEMEKDRTGLKVLTRPIVEGLVDLRKIEADQRARLLSPKGAADGEQEGYQRGKTRNFSVSLAFLFRVSFAFLKKYFKFFLFAALFVLGLIAAIVFFKEVLTKERSFKIMVPRGDVGMPEIFSEIK